MKTDALFYRISKEVPESFFELIGWPASAANRYRFDAIELKDTAVRIDGLFTPVPPDDFEPVFFVEFQTYTSDNTYSNLFLKVGLYLEKVNPRQNWQAAVIYMSRSLEQENLLPFRSLLQSGQFMPIYLDELPAPPPGHFGLELLSLMAAKPAAALAQARQLIPRIRASALPTPSGEKLIELIETIVLYFFPKKSREELEKMLQVNDVRETRVFQEALEEGREEGREEEREDVARRLLARKFPLQEIVELSGLSRGILKRCVLA